MSTIYLIRHGKTAANEQRLYCGSTDLSLSQAGAEELRQLHYSIENAQFITSGMKRTTQTLHILFGDVPYSVDPGFREIDFGIFEMQSYDQLKDLPAYQLWLTGDNEANIPPEGESGNQMSARVLDAFERLYNSDKNIVIISHGGVISAIMAHLFPDEGKSRYQWQPKPGHGYRLENESYDEIP